MIREKIEISECRLLWLRKRGMEYIIKYLEDNRKNINKEFYDVRQMLIAEKKKEINTLKLIPL